MEDGPTHLSDLNDNDAGTVLKILQRIITISNHDAMSGNGKAHEIYQLARDARDLMMFDQISRETLRRLGASTQEFQGVAISDRVVKHIRDGEKINAIKELRTDSGLGLKEAKDIVESIYDYVISGKPLPTF
jgi:ribosomal protein L7/L12